MRSCSSEPVTGQGKTSSSWISPRKSDFANDETPSCASSFRGIASRTPIASAYLGSQSPNREERAADREHRPEQQQDLTHALPLMRPERERDPEREDHQLEAGQRHQREATGRDGGGEGEAADGIGDGGGVQPPARLHAEPDAADEEAEHGDVAEVDQLRRNP